MVGENRFVPHVLPCHGGSGVRGQPLDDGGAFISVTCQPARMERDMVRFIGGRVTAASCAESQRERTRVKREAAKF